MDNNTASGLTDEAAARFYAELGTRVRQARLENQLSQLELGRAVGLNRSSIANIEAARQRPLAHMVVLISEALKVPAAELLPKALTHEEQDDVKVPPAALDEQPEDTQEFVTSALRRMKGGHEWP